MTSILTSKWNKALETIRTRLPKEGEAYQKWFAPILPIAWENNILTIRVASAEVYEKIENDFIDELSTGLITAFGENVQIKYQFPAKEEQTIRPTGTDGSTGAAALGFATHLDGRLSLETFYPSDCNRLAYNAGLQIIKEPGKSLFNPLFIHGASGVGKTHLMHAIGNQITAENPALKVVYIPAQTFKRQFVTATIMDKNNGRFFAYYHNIDVLLIDDIQELREAEGTQNAFFQIFNNLKLLGKQIIITSDRAPIDLKGMEERLYTRLRWGLTVEINRPDAALRKIILTKKIEEAGVKVPAEVFDFIVAHTKDNVRDIEGSLTSLLAHSLFRNAPLNLDLAKQVMAQTVGLEEKAVDLPEIIKCVTTFYNVTREDLESKKRTRTITTARQMVMYLAKKHTSATLKVIGAHLGGRDHSTIKYGIETMEALLSTEQKLRGDLRHISDNLGL